MNLPISTYRVQLHEKFNFHQLEEILEYLHELGISTVYASPITQAIKGSQHGYDVTDPQQISIEIGTEEDLERIVLVLQKYNMTWVQDIVPNHMAYDSNNSWLYDVLEKGKDSPYYTFFDIEPDPSPLLGDKVMVPFLGDTLTECLQKGEIRLGFTGEKLVIRYFQQQYPVAISSYKWFCTARPGRPLREQVDYFNTHIPLLKELLDLQHYILTHSHLATSVINYRRFFTVNSLICLRMEDQRVFDAYHRQIRRWYEKGLIQGLRVDHIDGLAAPAQYIHRLRQVFGGDCYIVAEKILAAKEPLPRNWELQGTTGYEFLAAVSQLLTDPEGFRRIETFYLHHIAAGMPPYDKLVFERKLHYLRTYMGGELDNLVHRAGIGDADKNRFRNALAIFMSSFGVYRLYPGKGNDLPDVSVVLRAVSEEDRALLKRALADAGFLSRVMQFTGVLAAKGIEDTVFYDYNPLIARNEVGDAPSVAGLSAAEFHQKMILRQDAWPHSLNAGTTHDTKRGEDSRIRLCWLSSIPEEWMAAVSTWREMNRSYVGEEKGKPAPLPNDEYFIYQSLLGGFPTDLAITDAFRTRFHDMLTKALREAKMATSWDKPDEDYERKCHAFVDALLSGESSFMSDFLPFARKCIQESMRYSLSQLLLRLTAPGIPDIYQGSEYQDLSFVDPDNRRPVDYGLRRRLLRQVKEGNSEGAEKMYTIYKTLAYRNTCREVFSMGEYIPIGIAGAYLGFVRHYEKDWALIIVPLIRMASAPQENLSVRLPEGAPAVWTNIFTGESFKSPGAQLDMEGLLKRFPVAMLTGRNE